MEEKTSILIVDDDLGMSETLSDILGELGYKVAVANNGFKAIKLVNKDDYNMALIDIMMPGINGVEIFKEIKNIRPAMKVIMMTAYSVEDLVKEALKECAYGIIYKPLNIDDILNIIEKIEKKPFILIVDDDPHFCETLKDDLEEMKYNISVSYNGKQAISYIKENDVDIILIGVKMPELNGLELFLTIREINSKITGIMITDYHSEVKNLVEEAIKNDFYSYLYKPLDKEKLIKLIEEICRKKFKI